MGNRSLMLGIVLAIGLLLRGEMAEASTIVDFEDWSGGSGYQYAVISHGLTFIGALMIAPRPETNNPTNSLSVQNDSTFKFWGDGTPFPILSLDFQEGMGIADAKYVELMAYIAPPGQPSSQVIQTFTLDGDPTTFQTFYPIGLSDVRDAYVNVRNSQGAYASGGISVDNIVIPEPAAFSLVVMGLMILCRYKHS